MALSERIFNPAARPRIVTSPNSTIVFYKAAVKSVFFLSLAAGICLLFYRLPLPDQNRIREQVSQTEPVQTQVEVPLIEKEYKNFKYKIQPLYSYELSGLVVSEYTSSNWLDIMHKQDPGNTRDLCVIWQKMITSGVYQQADYGHGEFTCTFELKREADRKIVAENPDVFDYLSNNHLLPATEEIAGTISRARVGDQVHFKGYLSTYEIYSQNNQLISWRGTSTTRKDTGNGACETVYVTEFEILQQDHTGYWTMRMIIPRILAVSAVLMLGLIFMP